MAINVFPIFDSIDPDKYPVGSEIKTSKLFNTLGGRIWLPAKIKAGDYILFLNQEGEVSIILKKLTLLKCESVEQIEDKPLNFVVDLEKKAFLKAYIPESIPHSRVWSDIWDVEGNSFTFRYGGKEVTFDVGYENSDEDSEEDSDENSDEFSLNLLKIREKLNLPKECVEIPDGLLLMAFVSASGVKKIPERYILEALEWGVKNYEYPEFVGDAILDLIVVLSIDKLKDPSTQTPNAATRIKSSLVQNKHLDCIMKSRGLCDFVVSSAKEISKGKVCADVFEAILGVLYIYLQPTFGHETFQILEQWILKEWKFEDELQKIVKGTPGKCVKKVKFETGLSLSRKEFLKQRQILEDEIREGLQHQLQIEYRQRFEEDLKEYHKFIDEQRKKVQNMNKDELRAQISVLQKELSSREVVDYMNPKTFLSNLAARNKWGFISYKIVKNRTKPTEKHIVVAVCPKKLEKCAGTMKGIDYIGVGTAFMKKDAEKLAAADAIRFLEEQEIIPKLERPIQINI